MTTRYSEKSFEIRFCAALSAAINPADRNPQWFGLTQMEERRVGVDTVLGMGGFFFLFQFKAIEKGSSNKFKLDIEQLYNLSKTATKYPDSAYYVFPDHDTIQAAAAPDCIFEVSRCVNVSKFNGLRPPNIPTKPKTRTLTLNTRSNILTLRHKSVKTVPAETSCSSIGCYCSPSAHDIVSGLAGDKGSLFQIFARSVTSSVGGGLADIQALGIPISREPISGVSEDVRIKTAEQFEELIGSPKSTPIPGLRGLFLPSIKRSSVKK